MTTIKSYTDLDQSRKLSKILPLESADMMWVIDGVNQPYVAVTDINENLHDTPAWSLSALLKLLPSEFTTVGKNSSTTYRINIRKYKADDGVDLYQIAYGNYVWHEDEGHTWHDMINTGQKEDFIDAAFDMLVRLKENKFL